MSEGFIEKLDEAVVASGMGDRAKFIRQAIREKAADSGIVIPNELASTPSRQGKGGPKPKENVTPHAPLKKTSKPTGLVMLDEAGRPVAEEFATSDGKRFFSSAKPDGENSDPRLKKKRAAILGVRVAAGLGPRGGTHTSPPAGAPSEDDRPFETPAPPKNRRESSAPKSAPASPGN